MNLYLVILKAFLNHKLWSRYNEYIDKEFLKENHPELSRLYAVLPSLHATVEDTSDIPGHRGDTHPIEQRSVSDLALVFKTGYPNASDTLYNPILKQLEELEFQPEKVEEYLEAARRREKAAELATKALEVAEGKAGWASLEEVLAALPVDLAIVPKDEKDFIDDTLHDLEVSQHSKPGLRWRLDSLNRALGSLRKGDFGFLFARPETGKTTFLASEVTHMATQTDRPVLWFNNEEQGGKVLLRCYQGALGCELPELWSDKDKHEGAFRSLVGDRIRIIRDPAITKRRVEALCKQYQPGLVIFDQIDKIKGFHDNERQDIELKQIYVWARELAKTYCPVLAVCQAGASGDGKKWLTMNDVDNSKTGKQGEADFILGIGKTYDEGLDRVRYLHLSKNKLLGDHDADESMRHGKWEVRIRPEVARYEDF